MSAELQSVKSKQRMAAHGEVFTPAWIVEAMIDLIGDESARIDSRILEPACGSGNFLVPVLRRKLSTVHARYGKSDFERCHQALFALMSIYGIELLEDNAAECRDNLLKVFAEYVTAKADDKWETAASNVLRVNIVNGDALSMTTQGADSKAITFAEWAYLGKGVFHRRDFRFDNLAQMSSFGTETLFGNSDNHDIFIPVRDHGPMSVMDIAGANASE